MPELHGITTRVLKGEDETRVRELLQGKGYEWLRDLDWTNPETWVAAEVDEIIEAFIQVSGGRPIARLEFLVTNDNLNPVKKAKIVKVLILTATNYLRLSGSDMAMGVVPFEKKSFKKLLKNRGGFVVLSGNMIAMRFKHGKHNNYDSQ